MKLSTDMIPPHAFVPVAAEFLDMELRNQMEEFLEQDYFSLMIQPVVSFQKDPFFAGEALCRLSHPKRGTIFPDVFLPVLDSMGLYPRFDRYIFTKCCAWISRSLEAGEHMDCISINFSRTTLSEEHLAQDLIEIADSYGIPHSILGIEITEQIPESDVTHLLNNLNLLKATGFRIILDDFGSGVTSFNDLTNYPLDIVKIDRSLLLKADTVLGATAYCGLVAMATNLGAEVVCEGIESEEQSRFAREAGCHFGQGYLFSRPVPQDQVFELMRNSIIREENT